MKPYLTKGKQVAVDGFLKQDRWQDATTGQNRSAVKIVANDIQLLGGRDGGARDDDENPRGGRPRFEPAPQNGSSTVLTWSP